jgi:hypothetical protein
MREFHFRNVTLMAAAASCFITPVLLVISGSQIAIVVDAVGIAYLVLDSISNLAKTYIFWGVVPAAIAFLVIATSVRSVTRSFGVVQLLIATPVILASVFSLLVLKAIFIDGGWPTYLPHFLIAGTCVASWIQLRLARRKA